MKKSAKMTRFVGKTPEQRDQHDAMLIAIGITLLSAFLLAPFLMLIFKHFG